MKTVSDNEIIDTSRGHKRIGALFDENAILSATNKDLLLIQADLLAALEAIIKMIGPYAGQGRMDAEIAAARSAIAKARGE